MKKIIINILVYGGTWLFCLSLFMFCMYAWLSEDVSTSSAITKIFQFKGWFTTIFISGLAMIMGYMLSDVE